MPRPFLTVLKEGLFLIYPLSDSDDQNDQLSIHIDAELHQQLLAITDAMGLRLVRKSKPVAKPAEGLVDGFDAFWKAYPRKEVKAAALKSWRANGCTAHAEAILRDVERRAATADWQKEGGKYVPMATTYLNQQRWRDAEEQTESRPDSWL